MLSFFRTAVNMHILAAIPSSATFAAATFIILAQKQIRVTRKYKAGISLPYSLCRISGKRITSLMDDELVSSIINLSIPMPNPPAGGMPYSRAVI